jgi:hypothetical protein
MLICSVSNIKPNIQEKVIPGDFSTSGQPEVELKKMSVLLLLFLTFITSGIYYPVWFLTRLKGINSLRSNDKLGSGVFIFAIIIISISILAPLVSLNEYGNILSSILQLTFWILMLVQCFKVRRIFIDHYKIGLRTDADFSVVGTFFFQICYLQYKINRI